MTFVRALPFAVLGLLSGPGPAAADTLPAPLRRSTRATIAAAT